MVFFFVSFLFFLLFIVLCFLGFYFGQHFESTIDLLFDDEDDIYDDRLGNLIQTRILYCFFFLTTVSLEAYFLFCRFQLLFSVKFISMVFWRRFETKEGQKHCLQS